MFFPFPLPPRFDVAMRIARIILRFGMVAIIGIFGALLVLPLFVTAQPTAPPEFISFSATASGACSTPDAEEVPVTLNWATSNADKGWIAMDTPNAKSAPLAQVAPSGEAVIAVSCPVADTTWTVTVEGESGLAHENLRIRPGEPEIDAADDVLFLGTPPAAAREEE